ncbi:MAG: hypothetical protein MPK31_09025 [Gammaproteobacteria bacterium]|nr:hypothetical protein [Gammaproteobacteria bacterium]
MSARNRDLQSELQNELESAEKSGAEAGGAAQEIIDLAKEIARLESEKAAQRRRVENAESAASISGGGGEHLLGVKVRNHPGQFIMILLNSSASMIGEMQEEIGDYLINSARGIPVKHDTPKWKRALSVVDWIIERVPEGSYYMIVHYNKKADLVVATEDWMEGGDEPDRKKANAALEKLRPQGWESNLYAALQFLSKKHWVGVDLKKTTEIYLVTDSLPTLQTIPVADSLPTVETISQPTLGGKDVRCRLGIAKDPEDANKCRRELFYNAANSFSKGIPVNTVLLPIEDDPDAAYDYWRWTHSTGGITVFPESSWP